MLRALAFRHVDLAHLRRRRLPYLGRFAGRCLQGGTCVGAFVRARLAVVGDMPARIVSVARLLMASLLPGFCRSRELDGSECHVNEFEVVLAGVTAQVARSLQIRVRLSCDADGQVRMSRTRRLHATKSSISPYTDTSVPLAQRTACKSFFFRWHRAHTCRRHRLWESDTARD